MSLNETLEKRAERGTARGSAAVWSATQHALRGEAPQDARVSKTGLRVALVLSAAALVVLAGLATQPFGEDGPALAPIASEEGEPAPGQQAFGLPAPILIDGMDLRNASEPWGDAERDSTVFTTGESPTMRVTSTRVYADQDDPFGGPIVGVDTLAGGGFSPWSANLSTTELSALTSAIVRDGTSWRLPGDSALAEVASFDDDHLDIVRNLWQFDFSEGADEATLQAEGGSTPWIWLSRLLRDDSSGEPFSVLPTDVLGNDGLIVDGQAFWVEGDYVYRLLSSELVGDTLVDRPVEPIIDRLQLVDRTEWASAVDGADGIGISTVAIGLSTLGFAVWVFVILVLAALNRQRALPLLLLALLGAAAWWALAPANLFLLAIALLSLAAFGLLRTVPRDE